MTALTTLRWQAFIIISLALLIKFAAVFVWTVHFDTNYYLNIGSNFIERGGLTPYMWRIPPDANIVAGSGTGYGILAQAWWLHAFGLSLVSGRLLTYLWGALALIPLYFSVRKMWDAAAATMTVTLAGISVTFLSLLTMRMDAAGMFFYSIALCVHVYAVYGGQRWLHVLTGVLAIVSTEFHILGTVYLFGLALYYLVEFVRTWRRERRIPLGHGAVFYYAGAGIAGLVYIYFRVLPNPEHYFLIPQICPLCGTSSPDREAVRYVVQIVMRPVEALLLVFALRTAIARRQAPDVHYLLLLAGCAMALAVISPLPLPIYTSHLWPVMMLGTGVAITRGHGRRAEVPAWRLQAVVGLAALVLVIYSGYIGYRYTRPTVEDPRLAYIRENVPTDAVVAANDRFYHQLLDYPAFISSGEEFGLLVGTLIRDETGAELWAREQPAAVMLDYDNATSVSEPEHVDSLRAYIDERGLTEVVPGLWVDLEAIGREAVENE
ncbi:MAG: glycosyltransferase family 39 protein [Chloroflexota bacterium]